MIPSRSSQRDTGNYLLQETPGTVAVPRNPRTCERYLGSPQAGRGPSTGAERSRFIASTSLGVAGRTEGHPNAFSKQTNCFSSPLASETRSFLDRRKPPRKCRLNECSPGETGYTVICLGQMAPTFELSRKTLTTPPSPIARLRCWARSRPSRDAARAPTRVGNAANSIRGSPQLDRRSKLVIHARRGVSSLGCRHNIGTFTIVVHRCVLHRSA